MHQSYVLTLKGSLLVQTASESIDRIGTLEVDHDGIVHVGDPIVNKIDSTS